ncbi:hypothetical protein PVAND_012103 [Polypedilum vanderplanki]|uniref:SEC7 domain-containing protein n=1 Tax=Polypedilum vanderplanki TaxID=319348 RepID=A0A9J6CMB6_POLVA|nr:hypothetical protein PVAND_012103 [Polypedilum vanderplanki]
MEDHKKNSSKIDNIKSSSAAVEHSKKSSLPQTSDRPLCSTTGSFNTSTEQYSFENQSSSSSFGSESHHHHHHHHHHQHVIDSHLSYDIEDDIINMDDDESNHSYVYLQSQQHYTPPPVEFQEGSTPQHQPSLIKKGSIMRNNPELMKRNRQNNSSYELSQDLLDKQIELLERKYGGIRARKAAICIQRAFRHYKMVKKFASITAMAKADKRISNRCSMQSLISVGEQESSDLGISQAGQKVCAIISATPPGQPRPSANRAVSFRERRNVLDSNFNQVAVKRQPLSQSNFQQQHPSQSSQPPHSHAYVNLLHSQDQQYNNYQNYHSHNNSNNNNYASNNSSLNSSSLHQYELNISSSSANTTMNSSWNSYSNSPNASLIAQQQYYVRPRTSSISNKKVPPEVPKRTSSIQPPPQSTPPQKYPPQAYAVQQSSRSHHHHHHHHHHHAQMKAVAHSQQQFYKTENGNHSSPDSLSLSSNSPVPNHSHSHWQNQTSIEQQTQHILHQQYILEQKHIQQQLIQQQNEIQLQAKLSETIRKRQYRIGLNLFNKKPEKGITYLMHKNFLENSPHAVSKFLISRKGLSRQMIGEYLGNLQQPFNMAVLEYFVEEMDCSGLPIDVALRKFQSYFRMPGEAQKIERLMEVFSHRYAVCNPDVVAKLRSPDTIFVLAFAIIMLNTDLHTPNIKADRRMKCEDFIKNLRGIDDCMDIDKNILVGIYERIKESEFKTASDHVTQVMKVQKTIVGKKLNLAVPHRRLVCYCRLYEIDINKKERQGLHQREVFLFNDLLVVTKILTKKKASVTYTFRNSFSLVGLVVTLLDVPNYPFCIRLSQKADKKILATFNARNEHDRCKFADDLRESIAEMDEMESIRIEMELERQMKATRCVGNGMNNNNVENRDSGVGDIEALEFTTTSKSSSFDTKSNSGNDIQNGQLKRGGALSNSLLDIHDQFGNECRQRRGSVGSLDSGMSISFQSNSTNNNNASNCKNPESSTTSTTNINTYVSTQTSAIVQRQPSQQQHANGNSHPMMIPPLLPNSALYQYNNDQMVHMHELYEEHTHTRSHVDGRSTDV